MFNIKQFVNRITDNRNDRDGGGESSAAFVDTGEQHSAEGFLCPPCMKAFPSPEALEEHYKKTHENDVTPSPDANSNPNEDGDVQLLRQEIEILQKTLAVEKSNSDELKREMLKLETDLNAKEVNATSLLCQEKDLEETKTLLTSEVTLLRQQLADSLEQISIMRKEKENVASKASLTLTENEGLKQEITSLQAQLAHSNSVDDAEVLRHELVTVQKLMNQLSLDKEKEIEVLNNKLNIVQTTAKADEKRNEQLTQISNELKTLKESKKEDDKKHQEMIEKHMKAVAEKDVKISHLEDDTRVTSNRIEVMDASSKTLKEECDRLRNQLAELFSKIETGEGAKAALEGLQVEIATVKKNLDVAQAQNGELSKEKHELIVKLEKSQEESQDFRQKLEKSSKEAQALQSKFEKSVEENQDFRQKLEKSNKEGQDLQVKLIKSQEESQDFRLKLEKSNKESQDSQSKLEKSRQENQDLHLKLEKSGKESQDLQLNLKKSQEETRDLRSNLEKCQAEIEMTQNELANKVEEASVLKAKYEEMLANKKNEIEGLKMSLDKADVDIKEKDSVLETLNKKLKENDANYKKNLEHMKVQVTSWGEKTKVHLVQNEELTKRQEILSEQVEKANQNMALIRKARADKEAELQETLKKFETTRMQLEEVIANQKQLYEEKSEALVSLQTSMDEEMTILNLKVTTLQDELTRTSALLQEKQQKANEWEEQVTAGNKKLHLLQTKVDEMINHKMQLEETCESNEQEKSQLLEKLISSESEAKSLNTTIEEITRKRDDAMAALQELGRENQSLQIEIAKIQGRKWADDSNVPNCSSCTKEFTLTIRKHHCRHCGQIFCSDCSSKSASVPSSKKPVRVCDGCYVKLTSP